MFQKLRDIEELPGGITEQEVEREYGEDIKWNEMRRDRRWMEFLAHCIMDKKNGTNNARYYTNAEGK